MPLAAAIIPAVGAIGGALIGGHAANSAAKTQAGAADYAANLQHQDAQAALGFQNKQFDTNQKNMAPWLSAGQGAVTNLSSLMQGGGFPAWNETFQAPTDVTEQNDPGYKFRLSQGMDALQNSAAARGGLLSGGTAKAINDYAQNSASAEYGNVYGRSLGEYQQRYNQFQNNQSNQFNRLATLSGLGQTSAAQLGQLGQSAAGNVSNILLNSGQQVGTSLQNAAYQRGSGYIGTANAYQSGLTNLANIFGQYAAAQQSSNPYAPAGSIPAANDGTIIDT